MGERQADGRHQDSRFPPDLSYQETTHACGYSPRALRAITQPFPEKKSRELEEFIFVGCKDGSIWVVDQDARGLRRSSRLLRGAPERHGEASQSGIRAICPSWSPQLLIVGRNNGTLEVLSWIKEEPNDIPTVEKHRRLKYSAQDLPMSTSGSAYQLRTISRLNNDWVYLSFGGKHGTYLLDVSKPESDKDPITLLEERLCKVQPLQFANGERVHEVHLICQVAPWENTSETTDLAESEESLWMIISERAEVFVWDGPSKTSETSAPAVKRPYETSSSTQKESQSEDLWHLGERPSFVNDYSRWGNRDCKSRPYCFHGIFLATDRGVFLLTLTRSEDGLKVTRPQRLSLPGLGLVCTAITYAESSNFGEGDRSDGLLRYLWVVDSRGVCHLFCDGFTQPWQVPTLHSKELPNFRSSGFTHLGSQALLAYSWKRATQEGDQLFLTYARRDDSIAIGQYLTPEKLDSRQSPQERARQLLSLGCIECIREFIRDTDLHPIFANNSRSDGQERIASDYETFAEFGEILAERPQTRKVLEETLGNPSAPTSSALLLGEGIACPLCKTQYVPPIGESETQARDACIALDLWTLTLLGVIHRSLDRRDTERFCLGLLRWLEDSRKELRKKQLNQTQKPEQATALARVTQSILDRYEDCLRMVRKWGIYGEVNARRPSLVRPIEILERQNLDEQKLDLLAYEALLFQRSVDLLAETRWNETDGNSAWSLAVLNVDTPQRPCDATDNGDLLIAISWRWTGIEILQLNSSKDAMPTLATLGVVGTEELRQGVETTRFEPVKTSVKESERHNHELERKKHGHSRVVLLGQHNERTFLMMSAVQERGRHSREYIYIYDICKEANAERPVATRTAKSLLPIEESVYSILDLGGGQILLGLRGVEGSPTLQLITLADDLTVERTNDLAITSNRLGVSPSKQNRVLSMTRAWTIDRDAEATDFHDVVIGSDSGEVWRLSWPRNGDLLQESFFPRALDHSGVQRDYQIEAVTRLASSVRAVAYRREETTGGGLLSRVFVGGSDGSIVGLQKIGETWQDEASYASIWATWERGGPVTHLQFIETPTVLLEESSEAYQAPQVFVAAVTQAGYSTVFDDRGHTPEPPDELAHAGPRRIPFPGCRNGRFFLGDTLGSSTGPKALAAVFLNAPREKIRLPGHRLIRSCACSSVEACNCPESSADGFGRLSLLVSATDRGTLHLHGLHLPDLTQIRRNAYKKLKSRWWAACKNKEGVEQLRLGEAAFGVTRAVSLTLTRWLLEADLVTCENDSSRVSSADIPITESFPCRWQLPRHLRPLLDLRLAWSEFESLNVVKFEKQDAGPLTELPDRIGRYLDLALRASRRLEDLELYQEICEVVLRRANHLLTEVEASSPLDEALSHRIQVLYHQILETVERSLEYWVGRPNEEESRARIVVAKNLVDGFTFLSVIRRATIERAKRLPIRKRYFTKILEMRISGVRKLVFKRDSLVSLETLRAANLSMMRMCRRLMFEKAGTGEITRLADNGWVPRRCLEEESPQEVPWEEISSYIEELVFAAARAFQSPAELSDALAHEYARSFALVICACPSAAIRLVNRLTETRLIVDLDSPLDLARSVERQLRVIQYLGLSVPPRVMRLFALAARGPRRAASSRPNESEGDDSELATESATLRNRRSQFRLPVTRLLGDPHQAGLVRPEKRYRFHRYLKHLYGIQNAQDLACIGCLHYILEWFEELSDALASDVKRIHATLEKASDLSEVCDLLAVFSQASSSTDSAGMPGVATSDECDGLYAQSLDFWRSALASDGSPTSYPQEKRSLGPIRPDLLELIHGWKLWGHHWAQDLKVRFDNLQIFQPEYSLFEEALTRLAHEAERFPEGAALQKAIVVGILGHHLLEDLDEHVLELEEIAQSLNPDLVRRYREQGRQFPHDTDRASTGDALAEYLIRRSHRAESIPENLRKLYGILDQDKGPDKLSLQHLLTPYDSETHDSWEIEPKLETQAIRLPAREAMYLELVLAELHQNHKKYATDRNRDQQVRPRVDYASTQCLELSFPFVWSVENFRRLDELIGDNAQRPLDPSDDRSAASNGTGIYLAHLAAAAVGWSLKLSWSKQSSGNPPRSEKRPTGHHESNEVPGWVSIYRNGDEPPEQVRRVTTPILRVSLAKSKNETHLGTYG